MRTCPSCGRENPPDRDFCECGEYLRWEPTGSVEAITPEMAAAAAEAARAAQPAEPAAPPGVPVADAVEPAPPPQLVQPEQSVQPATVPPPPLPAAAARVDRLPSPIPAIPKTLVHGTVAKRQPLAAPLAAEPDGATIVLRLPDGYPAKEQTLQVGVEPGQSERVLALVRNQSGIVDNYDLRVDGLPGEWWDIYPGTVYLVPFGAGGMYEQEVEIHLHPPRTPDAEARMWDLRVAGYSKAHNCEAASAPLALHIAQYVETVTKVRPQRRKGRRKADFDVAVTNKANAPVLVALEGTDADEALRFGFNRPPSEIPAGAAVVSQLRVRPPKQIWIGRAVDHRLEVNTIIGDEAAERAAAEPLGADALVRAPAPAEGKKGFFRRRSAPRVPGVYGPRVYKPQLYPPDVNIGPGGISLRKPQIRAPQVQGPQMGAFNASQLKPGQISMPGRGGASAPIVPLMPTQAVFRQKAWLPWWLIPLIALLSALLVFLYLLLPKNVVVPKVTGAPSAFKAEEKLVKADLKLDPNTKEQVDAKAAPGTVLKQTPEAGAKAEKGSPVTILVAVGTGKVTVPDITKKTASDAEKLLRAMKLTLGQASPQPIDPKKLIESQIPVAGEVVNAGTAVSIFYPNPASPENRGRGRPGGGGGEGGGGEKAATDIIVPAFQGKKLDAYAKEAADLGIVPVVKRQFNDALAGTLFGTLPPGGSKVANGAKVQLLVSAGVPRIAFSNGNDIRLVDGASGRRLEPIADGPAIEKDPTWASDGHRVAYVAGRQVYIHDLAEPDEPPRALTAADAEFENLAWSPKGDVLAMDRVTDGDTDLCLLRVQAAPATPRCKPEPTFQIGRVIHWAPDGRSLLSVGTRALGSGTFGIVRWSTTKPFSADPVRWSAGRFVTDPSTPEKGVADAAISPDGKHMAVVSNLESSSYRLWLTTPGDFSLTNARRTLVRACKVAWRSDSHELAVVAADRKCHEEQGTLARLALADPNRETTLAARANDPAYQPIGVSTR